jgi:phage baseplate assembly protein W
MSGYRAISFPFRFSGGKVVQTKTYPELVRAQVIDALMTNQGERVFRPMYGCDVQAALFDPRDELVRRDAAGIIRKKLEQFVPRCVVLDVRIDLPPESSMVHVIIHYRASLLSTDEVLNVPLEPTSAFFARSQLETGDLA